MEPPPPPLVSSSCSQQQQQTQSIPSGSRTKACLDDYNVLEKVGQGAQGSVFRGVHKHTGAVVAIKQIDVSFMNQKERVNVLAEVKVLATLAEAPHPCVMTYEESFVEQGSLWIVLEWSANGTLQDAFTSVQKKRRPEFEEDEVWNVFLSLALALSHVHDAHVLHRDVKMANVFLHYPEGSSLSPFGALPRIQLGDFGVSTILDDRSRALTMVGTPYYLSPELCMGKSYSTKSDVWSLGVLLFVLLNQKMPYEASNYAALILRIVQEAEAKHHPASSKFSVGLRRMATWCLQKEERQRPTAKEILLHPDCMKRLMRLGLPVPPALLEAACYRAPSVELAPPQPKPTGHRGMVTAPPSNRPLPKRVGPVAPALAGRRKMRVVQGASNLAQAPPAAVLGTRGSATPTGGTSSGPSGSARVFSASRSKDVPAPGTNVLRVMNRAQAGAAGQPAGAALPAGHSEQRPMPTSASRNKRDVAAVRGLPSYTDGAESSDDEGKRLSKPLATRSDTHDRSDGSALSPTIRRLHSYERRMLEADPSKAKILLRDTTLGSNTASPVRVGSSSHRHETYVSHLRSFGDGERPGTRGIVDASAETVALLRKHELVPEGFIDDCPRMSDSTIQLPVVTSWGHHPPPVAREPEVVAGGQEWAPMQHANVTLLGRTNVSSIPDETLTKSISNAAQSSSVICEEPQLLASSNPMYAMDDFEPEGDSEEDLLDGVGFVEEETEEYRRGDDDDSAGIGSALPSQERCGAEGDDEVDSEDDNDFADQPPPAPPGVVVWRIDGVEGTSNTAAAQARTVTQVERPALAESASDDLPTQYFDQTSELQEQVHALCSEGEALVGTVGFAEIVEVLTRDVPLSSSELQSHIQLRIGASCTPEQVPALMYVCFRYIMLAGELQKLRRGGA